MKTEIECFDHKKCIPYRLSVCNSCGINPYRNQDIDFYHAISMFETKHVLPILGKKLNYLLSARMLHNENRFKDYVDILREYSNKIFVDSGMIGAWKKNDKDWMNKQDTVIRTGKFFKADIVSMLDLPMEPQMLKGNMTQKNALKQTWINAEAFRDMGKIGIKKCFVIQGWKKKQYMDSIEKFDKLKIWEDADLIGIGTVCMRTPKTGLYDICKFVSEEIHKRIDIPVHTFGIAKPSWIQNLKTFGISSFDSATAGMCSIFYHFFSENRRINTYYSNLGSHAKKHLFALNLLVFDDLVKGGSNHNHINKNLNEYSLIEEGVM